MDITTDGNSDIWVIDIARAVLSRITFEPWSDWNALWSPDGSRFVFASAKADAAHIYEKSSTGVGNDQLVYEEETEIPVDWSSDGRYIVFSRIRPKDNDTWFLETAAKKAAAFMESPFDKSHAKLSPSGRWLAYTTNDSGIYQIVVQSFPDPNGGKWQITSQGGVEPKWRRDGRELYYLDFDGKLMSVSIRGDRSIEAGNPVVLFQTPLNVNRTQPSRTRLYDVAQDGRFLIAAPAGTSSPAPVTAVVNWASGLER
jgi:Tol biopolymer transport system component